MDIPSSILSRRSYRLRFEVIDFNDLFLIYGAGIEKIDFKIWNPYGELVFHSTDPNYLQHTG